MKIVLNFSFFIFLIVKIKLEFKLVLIFFLFDFFWINIVLLGYKDVFFNIFINV